MKEYISYFFVVVFFSYATIANCQVGIGTETPHSSTVLDVVSNSKGFLAPQINLNSVTDVETIDSPAEGTLVYNTTDNAVLDPGYYFWDGTTWQSTGIGERTNIVSDGVIPSFLGYTPNGTHPATNTTVTVDGVTFTNRGCKQWSGNGHWYCGYSSGANGSNNNPSTGGVNWGTAYNLGKQLKGYLTTITSLAEWNWIVDNIITGYNFQNNIWIGNSKAINMSFTPANQPAPGIPIEFLWITGEESKYNWSNATTVEQNFANNDDIQDEPNNLFNNEGCTHIWANGMSSGMNGLKLKWNDAPCDITIWTPGNIAAERRAMNQLIIEFQQ